MKNYEIEEQQDENTINTLDNKPVNNISNYDEVCIYDSSSRQSFLFLSFHRLNRDMHLVLGFQQKSIQK
jgi:hypothetical protein